ncbi:MAG: 2-oxoglutarate dehydrogenase complex dihydrolipoyllysine-residue succinyltransferase [Gammaproteobacteria bacterium]|nr:2-oxoglutarate dehydrogenase complex dihydrolipoyllysine-residue succinyltransferase [Gammaproteobacteria bacterium]
MSIEIKVPVLPESVVDAVIATWHKKAGEMIERDENIVDLETDKVVLEVPAPADGILEKIVIAAGETVTAGTVIAILKEGIVASNSVPEKTVRTTPAIAAENSASDTLSPAVRRLVEEHGVDVSYITGSGKNGRIVKEDVEAAIKKQQTTASVSSTPVVVTTSPGERTEKRVPMTRLRQRIAERLLAAKQNTAMLTTFNEVNLQAVIDLRTRYKESFEKQHGTRLGFMSFFTKASVEALKRFPDVNASIDGTDVIYHGYYDVGIAVSTERGLVVPVLRDVNQLSFADVEKNIKAYAEKARKGQLTLDDMTGGTFTITNGGSFGSLLATPILNPPQSAILGMHGIQQRPIVENGEIVARPMMYIALSYDHRIIDGKGSVLFLKTIKELLEDPARLLLDL